MSKIDEPLNYVLASFKHSPWGNSVVWWKADCQGYTSHLDEAGLYTRSQAEEIERQSCGADGEFRSEGTVAVLEQDARKMSHAAVDFNLAAKLWRDLEH